MSKEYARHSAVLGAVFGASVPVTLFVAYKGFFAEQLKLPNPTGPGFEIFGYMAAAGAGCVFLLLAPVAALLAAYGAHGATRWGIRLHDRSDGRRWGVMLLCAFGPVLVVTLVIEAPWLRDWSVVRHAALFVGHVGISGFLAALASVDMSRRDQREFVNPS